MPPAFFRWNSSKDKNKLPCLLLIHTYHHSIPPKVVLRLMSLNQMSPKKKNLT